MAKSSQLVSLNCGNYDSGLENLQDEKRRSELRIRLEKYIESKSFGFLHLQDLSDDPESFRLFENLGYSGFWIPNLVYSEGSISNTNSGLGSFFDSNLEFFMRKMYISLHQGNLPKITHYAKGVDNKDLIAMNCSLYQSFVSTSQKTIVILTNTYISPFSRISDRLQNILKTVQNIKQIKADLTLEYPDFTVIERFTGDMNSYGVNALYGPFGLKVSPWSFGLPLLSALFTGRNLPNERELSNLQKNLNELGYKFVPENRSTNQTISIEVEKYAPWFLKPLFKDKKVSWQLDICIVPEDYKIEAKIDPEPFGSFDHSSLIVF